MGQMDPETEKNLLSVLGMKKRPQPKKKIEIPDYMIELYKQQTGSEWITPHFDLKKKTVGPANTARSYHHIGKISHIHLMKFRNSVRVY